MQKVIILVIIGFSLLFVGNKTTEAIIPIDMVKIAQLIQEVDPGAELTEWMIVVREMSDTPYEQLSEKLKTEFSDWQWEESQSSTGLVLTGNVTDHQLNETLKMKVISTKPDEGVYLVFTVQGKEWSKLHRENCLGFIAKCRQLDIFTENPLIFSCMKGISSDTMDKASIKEQSDQWLAQFKAKPIESAEEDLFLSTTANSEYFTETINSHLNLQVAFRKNGLGGRTSFTIGTPLITNEY